LSVAVNRMQISWTYVLHNTRAHMSSASPLQQIELIKLYLDFCGWGFVPFFRPEEQAALFLSSQVNSCFTLKRLVFTTTTRLFSDILLLAFVRDFRGVDIML